MTASKASPPDSGTQASLGLDSTSFKYTTRHKIALVGLFFSASSLSLCAADSLGDKLSTVVSTIGILLNIIGFLWGAVKIYQGIGQINRGEDGYMNIIAGFLFAAVPTIANVVFGSVGGDTLAFDGGGDGTTSDPTGGGGDGDG